MSLSSEAQDESNDSVRVHNADELTQALANARDGQTIHLDKGVYEGNFSLSDVTGVTIEGEGQDTQLVGPSTESGRTLHLDHVNDSVVKGLSISGGQKGVLLDHSNGNILSDLDVGNTGLEAVHFRQDSSNNLLTESVVHDSGLVNPGTGEGVYVGSSWRHWDRLTGGAPDHSDGNVIFGNTIYRTGAEAIDIKEGTTDTWVVGNHFLDGDAAQGLGIRGENGAVSFVALKGNNATLMLNTYDAGGNPNIRTNVRTQSFRQAPGWARNNYVDDTISEA